MLTYAAACALAVAYFRATLALLPEAYASLAPHSLGTPYVSIRQHTLAYVSIRQHTQHTSDTPPRRLLLTLYLLSLLALLVQKHRYCRVYMHMLYAATLKKKKGPTRGAVPSLLSLLLYWCTKFQTLTYIYA